MFDPWQAQILEGLGTSGFQRAAYGQQRSIIRSDLHGQQDLSHERQRSI